MGSRLMSLGVAFSLVLAACGSSAPAPQHLRAGVHNDKMTVGTSVRTYRLFVPPSLDQKKSSPLLVALHGCGQSENADHLTVATHLDDMAAAHALLIAYPQRRSRVLEHGFLLRSSG